MTGEAGEGAADLGRVPGRDRAHDVARIPAQDAAQDIGQDAAGDAAADPARDPATAALLAARGGDRGAAAVFVRATQPEVWRFVAALVGPHHADDVTQDTYLRAFRALPEFAGRSTARTWVLAIARRACADHVRAAVRGRRLEARVAAEPEDLAGADHAGLHAAADLVAALPAERRVAFVLTQVLGLAYAEAAEIEDVPVGTIRSRVARARADLVAAIAAARAG